MPRDKNPAADLSRILAAMGHSPDQVADLLRAGGCRGFRSGNFPGPLVRYVYRRFDDGALALVHSTPGPRDLRRRPDRFYLYLLDGRREEVSLPAPVAEFLARFADGRYPDLELRD